VGSETINILQENDAFAAEAYVPVWTSQLYVNDWWGSGPAPLRLALNPVPGGLAGNLENTTGQPMEALRLVCAQRVFDLGTLAAKEKRAVSLRWDQGRPLSEWINSTGGNYQNVVQSRRRAFGSTTGGRLDDQAGGTLVASFISQLSQQTSGARFEAAPGMDLSRAIEGAAVLLAYAPGQAAAPPMKDFAATRSSVNTVWRLAVPWTAQP
jgi:hypothetical protein